MLATATADWNGSFHQGTGTISTASETLRRTPYTYASRFDGGRGASPEELLAAGLAGCYNHALANIMHKTDHAGGHIETTVSVDMGSDTTAPGIAGVSFTVQADLSGLTDDEFVKYTQRAGRTCALSKALSVPIEVLATRATTNPKTT